MPSIPSYIFQGTMISAFTTVGAFIVYTKHCHFEPLGSPSSPSSSSSFSSLPNVDPIFQSKEYRWLNPKENQTLHDVCVRRIPLFKIKRELWDESMDGDDGAKLTAEERGMKLVEGFCGGVYGGFGYTPQRTFLSRKYSTTHPNQLWTKPSLLTSSFPIGTEITNHFVVLAKEPITKSPTPGSIPISPHISVPAIPNITTNTTNHTTTSAAAANTTSIHGGKILTRCGDSPQVSPDHPRSSDGLFEITAYADVDRGFAEFRLKSVFFDGTSSTSTLSSPVTTASPSSATTTTSDGNSNENKTMDKFMGWSHRQYTKLLLESGTRNCMN